MLQIFYWLFHLIPSSCYSLPAEAHPQHIEFFYAEEPSFVTTTLEQDPQPPLNSPDTKEFLVQAELITVSTQVPSQETFPIPEERDRSLLAQKNRYDLWGGFLYWKARQDFMDIALTAPNVEQNECCGFSYGCGKVLELDGGFHPGFRGGGSLAFHDTDWKVLADYTFFNSSVSKSKESPKHGFLFVKWIQPNLISNNASSKLHAKWKLEMNVLNSHIGKNFFFGSKLSILPFWGIATAWIDQKFTNHLSLLFPEAKLKISSHSSSFLIGPRMGVSANYEFIPQFGIAANLAGEIFYAHSRVSTKQKSPDHSSVFLSSKNTFSRNNPEVEMYAALYYRAHLPKENTLKVELGYDFQVWWNQNIMRWYNDVTYVATPIGNLYFQGLRVSLDWGF